MPLQKQNLSISFAEGLDTKSDPFQVPFGKFVSLVNMVFTKAKLLVKRNGFQELPSPPTGSNLLTTFQSSLVSTARSLSALLRSDSTWSNRGNLQPISLSTLNTATPAVAPATIDAAVNANMICTVWEDTAANSFYQISDSTTGQTITSQTQITGAKNPRVFALGNNFFITYGKTVAAAPHLQYINIPVNTLVAGTATDIATTFSSITAAYDGVVSAGGNLYLAWNGNDGGGAIRFCYFTPQIAQSAVTVVAGFNCTFISVCADNYTSITNPTSVIWFTFLQSTNLKTTAYSTTLSRLLAPTNVATSVSTLVSLTTAAYNQVLSVVQQDSNTYSYSSARTDLIYYNTVTQAGVVGSNTNILRGMGLASKAFLVPTYGSSPLFYTAYGTVNSGALQPSYFLFDIAGVLAGRLAYSNGGGCYQSGFLPQVTVSDEVAGLPYLYKEIVQAVNPQSVTPPTTTSNIYAQLGIKYSYWDFDPSYSPTAEIGGNLNLSGAIMWAYDGGSSTEQNFLLFPDDIVITTSTSGGSITDQQYYYAAVYEWTDAQNNIHRSAPSIAVGQLTSGGNTSTNTINVPTLRITQKTNVRIVLYRWSAAQQTFYQVTSITSPTANNTAADSVAITDTLADSSILGGNILYTNGGVVENISPPGSIASTLFKSRAVIVDAEDQNLLWYSKQVIEATPLEFSDLFTIYVAPTIGAQGSTGTISAIAPMDDKLIVFKRDAVYYIVGNGPDITGANNDFSDPVFITGTVGCSNPASIVLMPNGLIFQSDKGIWLLGRDLSTSYIGAPVEAFNSQTVTSATIIPGTNQVRFTLDTNNILMYDYFYNQWGTFTTPQPVLSSTLFQDEHTYLTSGNQILQENPGSYVDVSSPVLISFITGWLNLMGLQGFQRAYQFGLLGTYFSPHYLSINIAYDYGSPEQTVLITPINANSTWGSDALWGTGAVWGGSTSLEQFRIWFKKQKCQAFQIQVSEVFNASYGTVPGAGLSLSGINLVVGGKKGYVPLPATQSVG